MTLTQETLVVSLVFHLIPIVSLHRCIPLRPAHLVQASSSQAVSSHSRCCSTRNSISPLCLCLCCLGGRWYPACAWGTLRLDARWPLRRPEVMRNLFACNGFPCSSFARRGLIWGGEQRNRRWRERCGMHSMCMWGVVECLAALCWSAPFLQGSRDLHLPSTELQKFTKRIPLYPHSHGTSHIIWS